MIASAGLAFNNFVVVIIVVVALYFARDILVPVALAILLSFLLAPVVRRLQRWQFPKAIAIIVAVVSALVVALSLSTMVVLEVSQLVRDLPRYQATLASKVHYLRDAVGAPGLLKNASDLLKRLDEELSQDERGPSGMPLSLPQDQAGSRPIPVEVHQPTPGASETLVAILRPLAAPFTTSSIILVFLTFFLFQREDLRDRFIRLAGSGDLERTTAALDDAGSRLGQLFLAQLLLNACFGTIIGLGLAVIGVPSAPLWGLLAMILRFVPYIGAALAAALPIALAAAVGSDWSMTIWTAALFAIVEALTGHIAEPLVCGKSAGLSPVAIVLAASFWTWLWGPMGLILSTPLTLCLVVLARHVERLRFIDIMLGDGPALTPQQAAYQRLLTGDPVEAIEQARKFLKEKSVVDYYEEILLAALRLAQADAERGRLEDRRLENIVQTVSDVIEDLTEHIPDDNGLGVPDAIGGNVATLNPASPVNCVAGLGRLDSCAALIIADVLKRQGIDARIATASKPIEENDRSAICLAYLEDVSDARIAYASRRLFRRHRIVDIIVCLLGAAGQADASPAKTDPSQARTLAAIVAAVREKSTLTAAGTEREGSSEDLAVG